MRLTKRGLLRRRSDGSRVSNLGRSLWKGAESAWAALSLPSILAFLRRLPLESRKPLCKQTMEAQVNRRIELLSIVLLALGAGVVGGIASSLADEMTRVEVGIGELRGEILSLGAPSGAVAMETNPNYKSAAAPVPAPRSPAAADWPSYNKT